MKTSLELKDNKALLKDKANEIISKCSTEIRNLNDDEQKEYNSIIENIKEINNELRQIEISLGSDNTKTKKNTMEKNFSLLKAIRSVANNKAMDEVTSAVVEAGASEMRKAGLNFVGQIQLPVAEERAAITVATEGEDVVATELFEVIKPLQARNVAVQAGAKFISGLRGDLQFPVMSNCATNWASETGEAQDGNITFTNVQLSPKRLTCVVPISKQFLIQDSVGAEAAIREEIINSINAKIEETIFGNGKGNANEPAGLFPNSGDSEVYAVTDFKTLTTMEGELEEKNVYGNMKYILSPKAKSELRNMAKSTKSTQLVYEAGEVDGTPALSTSHLKDKHIVFGDFSQYVIASWGNLDITVDNITLASSGQIRLIVNSYWDLKPLRKEAIKIAKVGA